VPKNRFRDLGAQAGTYTGRAQLDVYRNAIATEVPLVKAAESISAKIQYPLPDVEYERERAG